MSFRPSSLQRALTVSLLAALASPVHALMVTREFSGSWYDPHRVGQGFNIEIAEGATKQALVYWYTFDAQGRPLWLFGQSAVPQGTALAVTLFEVQGPRFGVDSDASQMRLAPWGSLDLTFADCNHATASYGGPLGSGTLSLVRLTKGFGANCTGTLVDDGAASASALVAAANANSSATGGGDTLIRVLAPTAAAPAASGRLKYRVTGGRVRFAVEVEDVPVGAYTLFGNGTSLATLTVVAVPGGAQAEVEFSSPAEAGSLPLDFDPRGMAFEVRRGGVSFLAGTLDVQGSGTASGGGTPGAGAPPFGNAVTTVSFAAASGKARLEQRSDRVDFNVEIEDVATGSYELRVSGITRGALQVQAVPGGTEGEIEFRTPAEPGKFLLDFDPRGQSIALWRNGIVVAQAVLPTQPTAVGSGNGNDGGSGNNGNNGNNGNSGNSGSGTTTAFPVVPRIRVDLQRVGPDADASGRLEFESSSTRQDFKVEVEDLADGAYSLLIAGTSRGTLQVSGGEAELEFRNPAEPGHPLLDFDVLDKEVQVVRGGTVYLRGKVQ